MKSCGACGAHVTPDFVRVFGTEDGEVYACPDCTPVAGLYHADVLHEPRRS